MNNRILRLSDVLAATGFSRTTVYRYIHETLWTKPVRLGARTVGWPENEVDMLIAARIAGYSDQDIKKLVTQLEAKRKQAIDVHQST